MAVIFPLFPWEKLPEEILMYIGEKNTLISRRKEFQS
jgi:hypothetical protein